MNEQKFNSDRAPKAVGLYPHARKVGNLLFLSGVGPRKAGQTEIPGVTLTQNGEIESYDIAAQCQLGATPEGESVDHCNGRFR